MVIGDHFAIEIIGYFFLPTPSPILEVGRSALPKTGSF
jgi:hypothetical protein